MSTKDWSQVIKLSDPDTLYNGAISGIGLTAAPMSVASIELSQGVYIRADSANTDVVYIGTDSVTAADGYPLAAGEEKFVIINDMSKVYLIGGAAAQAVRYLAS